MNAFSRFVILLAMTLAVPVAAKTSPSLTKKQLATVLNAIDSLCGDSWCEGDFNYAFKSFDCISYLGRDSMNCTLTFDLIARDPITNEAKKNGSTRVVDAVVFDQLASACEIGGIKSYSDLIDSKDYLTTAFSDDLSGCFSAAENNFRKRLGRK